MAIITPEKLVAYADYCVAFLIASEGTSSEGLGLGRGVDSETVWGASEQVANIKSALIDDTNLDSVQAVIRHVDKLTQLVNGNTYVVNMFAPFLSALESHVTRFGLAGVRNLNDYLTYLNTGQETKWQALLHPRWRDLRPFRTPSPWNMFWEIKQGAEYPNALGKLVIGTGFTAGEVVDQTKYAGGFPAAHVLSSLGGDGLGTLTVTGTAFDPATKTFITGRTWTAAFGGYPGNLTPGGATPAPTDSLIAAVSNMTFVGGGTGTIYVEAHAPNRETLPS